jgi:glycosyltransferase involved in cell wall biosynthesis
MIIRVDPAFDALYSTYYLEGCRILSPDIRLVFDPRPFAAFKHTKDYLPLVVEERAGKCRNIIIDFGDSKTFRKPLYEWADVYAKVNLTPEDNESYDKMLPLGPASLGIRAYSGISTLWIAVSNFLKARGRIPSPAEFFASYKASLRRLNIEGYAHPQVAERNYVHFVSTLWKDDKKANDYRVHFMDAVKRIPELNFEGGFVPRADGQTLGFEQYIGPAFEPLSTYREKIGRSFVVFNTPAVKQCHGWKLPEYLAWGKAIISTPPVRMLPEPLVDREHWLLTDGSMEDIEEKIRCLLSDAGLHDRLQKNARDYFDRNLRADVVMRKILERAGIQI